MKILGISGTHRAEGNTDLLVKRALEVCEKEGAETEFISLSNKKIEFCTHCDTCKESPHTCSIADDVAEILEKMKNSDAIVIGSPTYFASVSSRLKALFDRTLPLRRNNLQLSGKLGGAIAIGGSRNGGQEFTTNQIRNWMLLHEMLVVADKTTAHFGGIAVGRNPGDALEDETGLRTVENLALKICDVLKD